MRDHANDIAGQLIGRFQRAGSRLTIGKNISSYSHKHKSGGTASMRRNTWNPEGSITNLFEHAGFSRVLKPSAMQKAITDGGRNTITWYERAMQGRLNRRR